MFDLMGWRSRISKTMSITYVDYLEPTRQGLYDREKGLEPSVKKLALAILLRALRDLLAPSKSGKNNRQKWVKWQKDALHWFYSEKTTPGSFYWVCEVLNIGSWRILKGLRIGRDRRQLEEVVRKLSELQIRPQSVAGS